MQQAASDLFETHREGDVLIVVPRSDMGESDLKQSDPGTKKVLDALEDLSVTHLVMDFYKTQYFGSTALGFFVKLWKRIRQRDGRMAFCNLSDHELEILQITKLDHLWAVCDSRDDAIRTIRK